MQMVQTLNNGSINSLWEHSLSDAKCSKKKPQATDPLQYVYSLVLRTIKLCDSIDEIKSLFTVPIKRISYELNIKIWRIS